MTLKVDPKLCGAGKGAQCCAFLICGPEGFECGREIPSVKESMIFRVVVLENTAAKRLPVAAYPDCQAEDALDDPPAATAEQR